MYFWAIEIKSRIIVILNLKKMFNKFIQKTCLIDSDIAYDCLLFGSLATCNNRPIPLFPSISPPITMLRLPSGERITNCWLNRWSFRWKERLTEFQGWSTSLLMQVMMEKETIQAILTCAYRSETRRRWMFKTVGLVVNNKLPPIVVSWRSEDYAWGIQYAFCMSIFIVKIRKPISLFNYADINILRNWKG